jgi:hypothetical protein
MSEMSWRRLLTTAGTSGGAAADNVAKTLSARFLGGVPGDAKPRNRWLAVTVNCPPARLADLPAPLAGLTDIAEVRIRPAPGGRGTELAMRLFEQPPVGTAGAVARLSGDDPRQRVRVALRDAKSLIETGEVLKPDDSTNHPTPAGRLFDISTRLAGKEGRL